MDEIWKDVAGYENYFQVSNLGNIYSKRTKRLLNPGIGKSGYKIFVTRLEGRNSKSILMRVHRLVAKAFIPNPENKPSINHKNSVRSDNLVDNLEWCTSLENARHASIKGRLGVNKGEKVYNHQLTNIQAEEIRHLYFESKVSISDLMKKYNVSNSVITKVVRFINYK